MRSLLIGLTAVSLLTFLIASLGVTLPPLVWVHGVLAVGIFPLILAAMIYFTPVLTRGLPAERKVLLWPLLALVAGLLALWGFAHTRRALPLAALLGGIACLGLLGWMRWRAKKTLGTPHPCLLWYQWALVCLLLGLSSILIAFLWPPLWSPLKRLHLHLNTLGFVGLTALGTLQVLVPTTGKYQDPKARLRLARDWPFAALGTFLVALGAAWFAPLAWMGGALWLIPVGRFLAPLATVYRLQVWGWHKASAALAGASLGWLGVMLLGFLHAFQQVAPPSSVAFFFLAFLFPLVTGAASYLLPVWIWPGQQRERYLIAYQRLTWGSGLRTLAFLLAGLLALAGLPGEYLALAALLAFVFQVFWALSGVA